MNIRVCQHKCPDKETCEAFISKYETGPEAKQASLGKKPRSIEIGAV